MGPNIILSDVQLITTLYANDERYRKVSQSEHRCRSREWQLCDGGTNVEKDVPSQPTIIVSFGATSTRRTIVAAKPRQSSVRARESACH